MNLKFMCIHTKELRHYYSTLSFNAAHFLPNIPRQQQRRKYHSDL